MAIIKTTNPIANRTNRTCNQYGFFEDILSNILCLIATKKANLSWSLSFHYNTTKFSTYPFARCDYCFDITGNCVAS